MPQAIIPPSQRALPLNAISVPLPRCTGSKSPHQVSRRIELYSWFTLIGSLIYFNKNTSIPSLSGILPLESIRDLQQIVLHQHITGKYHNCPTLNPVPFLLQVRTRCYSKFFRGWHSLPFLSLSAVLPTSFFFYSHLPSPFLPPSKRGGELVPQTDT